MIYISNNFYKVKNIDDNCNLFIVDYFCKPINNIKY